MSTLTQIAVFHTFEPYMVVTIVAILLLLGCSAFMSGSETAFFSLSPADMQAVKKRGARADNAILKLLGTQDYLLATILILNNLVNISIVILSNNLIDSFVTFHAAWFEFLIKTVIVTFLLLLFGEIMPKVFSAYNPLRFARFTAVPLLGLKHLMKPFAWVLNKSGNVVNDRLSGRKPQISIDELSNAIEMTSDHHSEQERQMLSGIVNFAGREVSEIMKLRMDIVALDAESDFAQVKSTIIDSGYSRIPVYEENIDTIKGILYVKDMTPFVMQSDDFHWQAHLRKPYFVPENKKINDLLEEFQSQKVHIAIVVDEYGATQGLVSLEDILEEVVGEITDEHDPRGQDFYQKIDDNTYIFEGKTHLSDFTKVLELPDDYFGDVDAPVETLAGLLLELNRDFLQKGDSLRYNALYFTVTALDGRRIEKVRVRVYEK